MRAVYVLVLLLSVPACADVFQDEEPEWRRCFPAVPVEVDSTGTAYQYVVDTIDVPDSATEAQQLGIDLDCDPVGRPDNALGQIISIISSQDPGGYDLDAESKQLIDAGQMLHLLQVQTVAVDDAGGVGIVVRHGKDTDGDTSDNFSGQESFAIDETRGVGFLTGRIDDGQLTAEYGTAPVAVAFPGLEEPFVLPLIGARVDVDIVDGGLRGRIGGAVPIELVDSLLLPVFVEGLGRIVARDCEQGVCEANSFGETLIELFDSDLDGAITLEELQTNSLVSSLLSPDVDLRDEDGRFNPRTDEVKDSLSVGVGFTAVGASFSAQ